MTPEVSKRQIFEILSFLQKYVQKSFNVLPEVLPTGTKTVVSSMDCEGETKLATESRLAVEGEGSARLVERDFVIMEGDIGVYEDVVVEDNVAVGEG